MTSPTGSDPRLARAQQGDPEALDALISETAPDLWRLAVQLLGGPREAEGAVHEAIDALIEGLGDLGDAVGFRLEGLRLVLDGASRRSPRALSLVEREPVRAGLAASPLPERAAVVLHDALGLSLGEVAAVTGRPLGLLKRQIHAARSRVARGMVRATHERLTNDDDAEEEPGWAEQDVPRFVVP